MITKTIRYELADHIATITFDEQGSPVNTMCLQWQEDLAAVTAQVVQDKAQIQGIVLASAKSTFFAGADLKAVMRTQPLTRRASLPRSSASRKAFARWKPWAFLL